MGLLGDGSIYFGLGDVHVAQDVLVHHPYAATGDGAHGQLAIARRAKLAHHQNVQFQPKALRHFVTHRYASAWQRQDQRVPPAAQLCQALGQRRASLRSIGERNLQGHGRLLDVTADVRSLAQ